MVEHLKKKSFEAVNGECKLHFPILNVCCLSIWSSGYLIVANKENNATTARSLVASMPTIYASFFTHCDMTYLSSYHLFDYSPHCLYTYPEFDILKLYMYFIYYYTLLCLHTFREFDTLKLYMYFISYFSCHPPLYQLVTSSTQHML